jgi:hypothetical protein
VFPLRRVASEAAFNADVIEFPAKSESYIREMKAHVDSESTDQ